MDQRRRTATTRGAADRGGHGQHQDTGSFPRRGYRGAGGGDRGDDRRSNSNSNSSGTRQALGRGGGGGGSSSAGGTGGRRHQHAPGPVLSKEDQIWQRFAQYRIVVRQTESSRSGTGGRGAAAAAGAGVGVGVDRPVPWSAVEQVVLQEDYRCHGQGGSGRRAQCPICLLPGGYLPRITRCGHIFCLVCLLRFMDGCVEARCPICADPLQRDDWRVVADVSALRAFVAAETLPENAAPGGLESPPCASLPAGAPCGAATGKGDGLGLGMSNRQGKRELHQQRQQAQEAAAAARRRRGLPLLLYEEHSNVLTGRGGGDVDGVHRSQRVQCGDTVTAHLLHCKAGGGGSTLVSEQIAAPSASASMSPSSLYSTVVAAPLAYLTAYAELELRQLDAFRQDCTDSGAMAESLRQLGLSPASVGSGDAAGDRNSNADPSWLPVVAEAEYLVREALQVYQSLGREGSVSTAPAPAPAPVPTSAARAHGDFPTLPPPPPPPPNTGIATRSPLDMRQGPELPAGNEVCNARTSAPQAFADFHLQGGRGSLPTVTTAAVQEDDQGAHGSGLGETSVCAPPSVLPWLVGAQLQRQQQQATTTEYWCYQLSEEFVGVEGDVEPAVEGGGRGEGRNRRRSKSSGSADGAVDATRSDASGSSWCFLHPVNVSGIAHSSLMRWTAGEEPAAGQGTAAGQCASSPSPSVVRLPLSVCGRVLSVEAVLVTPATRRSMPMLRHVPLQATAMLVELEATSLVVPAAPAQSPGGVPLPLLCERTLSFLRPELTRLEGRRRARRDKLLRDAAAALDEQAAHALHVADLKETHKAREEARASSLSALLDGPVVGGGEASGAAEAGDRGVSAPARALSHSFANVTQHMGAFPTLQSSATGGGGGGGEGATGWGQAVRASSGRSAGEPSSSSSGADDASGVEAAGSGWYVATGSSPGSGLGAGSSFAAKPRLSQKQRQQQMRASSGSGGSAGAATLR